MRKILVQEFMSLDGMMSDPHDEMRWVLELFNQEMEQEISRQQAQVDTMIFGKKTYEIMANYWPHADPEEESQNTIDHMNQTQKIVLSHSLKQADWQNTSLWHSLDLEKIMELKNQAGKNIAIIGSAEIVRCFADQGLIDEYQLTLHPVILGEGKPLFRNWGLSPQDLKLVHSKSLSNGVVVLYYQPKK